MTDQSPQQQLEAARKAFEQEFERFVVDSSDWTATEKQRALADFRTRHLGKKSELSASKRLIGRIPAEERAAFGQMVQSLVDTYEGMVDKVELELKEQIENERT